MGAAAIVAAWGYTGGPRPYGYAGFGELFVFVFFGLVATVGTTYVAVERMTGLASSIGAGAGCLACALLVVNNLRDIPSDTVGRQAHAGRAPRRRPHPAAVRRAARRWPSSSPSWRRSGGRGCCWRLARPAVGGAGARRALGGARARP